VDDKDVKPRYEREILAHSGIGLIASIKAGLDLASPGQNVLLNTGTALNLGTSTNSQQNSY
jgi:3-oxoacyl-ACP reductase-like protein